MARWAPCSRTGLHSFAPPGLLLRLIPKDRDEKLSIRYDEIARLAFTGRDTAAGKSWETWVKKYRERKAAGETNIGIAPEKLD